MAEAQTETARDAVPSKMSVKVIMLLLLGNVLGSFCKGLIQLNYEVRCMMVQAAYL